MYGDDRGIPFAVRHPPGSPMPSYPEMDGRNLEDGPSSSFLDRTVMSMLPYSHSMDLHNDPRFFASNVIEKRLAAFSGLSVIASLTTGTAMHQCFSISEGVDQSSFNGFLQMAGVFSMGIILFMSLASTLVFVYQAFFTHRLMTAGPNGFELASNFYLHDDVVKWRHFAVRCLGLGLPLLLFSTGCSLYVKLCQDLPSVVVDGVELHPFAICILTLFAMGALVLIFIASKHDLLFEFEYRKRVNPDLAGRRRRQDPLG